MVETGRYIQRLFEHHRMVLVILTGAMPALGLEGGDGLQNFTESLRGARSPKPTSSLMGKSPPSAYGTQGSRASHVRFNSESNSMK
jgi:hypothetical protein